MNIDFSKCKTKDDVDKVFKEYLPQLKTVKNLASLIVKAAGKRGISYEKTTD